MIRVFISEGAGSLGFPEPPQGIKELLEYFREHGILHAVTTNGTSADVIKRFRTAGLPEPDIVVSRYDVGAPKPSPLLIEAVLAKAGVDKRQAIYLGDDDRTDTFSAINAHVLPLSAQYSPDKKPREYGLPVTDPKAIIDYLETFGSIPDPYFGWMFPVDGVEEVYANVDVRALIDQQENLRPVLERVLKNDENIVIGANAVPVGSVLMHNLVGSCYQSGLIQDVDTVTLYPSSTPGGESQLLRYISGEMSRVFRDAYVDDLLVRHTPAPSSRGLRDAREIITQFRTILVNPERRAKVEGRNILVLDDFTAWGYSLETARQMLLAAGAAKVTALAIAKFRKSYSYSRIQKGWDPYSPCPLESGDIRLFSPNGSSYPAVDEHFHQIIWPKFAK
jgi:hypothetical protein